MGWDWDSFKRTLAYAGRVIPKALAEAAADLWGTPLKAIVFFAILLAGLVVWSAFGQEAPVLAWIGAGVTAGLLGLAFLWKLFSIPARLTDGRNLIVLSSDQLMGRQIAAEFGEAYERLKPLYKGYTESQNDQPLLREYVLQIRLERDKLVEWMIVLNEKGFALEFPATDQVELVLPRVRQMIRVGSAIEKHGIKRAQKISATLHLDKL